MNKIVILAAGRGTRMQKDSPGVQLDPEQERYAAAGLKGLIPLHGHAYLDYVISAAADAGLTEVCLVVGPGRHPIRDHYEERATDRVSISFAVQEEPRGSADALLSAAGFAADDPFVVINSDNYYPSATLGSLRALSGSGMAGFRRDALVAGANIPPERIAAFAVVTADTDGYLDEIVEKPDPETLGRFDGRGWISMTCWRFGPAVLEACRVIGPSPRGEYELPDAVLHAVRQLGERIRVVPTDEAVLDLSNRGDIPAVAERLRGIPVRL